MLIRTTSDLNWHHNQEGTDHEIDLDLGIILTEVFETSDPMIEIVTRGADIRTQLVQLLTENNLRQMLAQTGKPTVTEGLLTTKWTSESDARWLFAKAGPETGKPELRGQIAIKTVITSDRSVHAIQALEGCRAGIADGIAELLMGALRQHLLGTTSSASETHSRTQDGKLTEYDATERARGEYEQN